MFDLSKSKRMLDLSKSTITTSRTDKVCPNDGCGLQVQRSRISQHASICLHKMLECRSCKQIVKRVDEQQHKDTSCPSQPVVCPHVGCGELTERRFLADHNAECGHKLFPCHLCNEMVKRMDEEDHAMNSCPKQRISCPRDCGAVVSFDAILDHLSQCPLEEIDCPKAAATGGCSTACPGRMRRKDLEAHLSDPSTMATVVGHLKHQASDYQRTITWQLLQKMHNISWATKPCPESEAVIVKQLSKHKKVKGEVWTTHHFAHEFPKSCFVDLSESFRFESKKIELSADQKAHATLRKDKGGNSIACTLYLTGFRGTAQYTITVFRFGRGPPRQLNGKDVWEKDMGWGWPTFFDLTDITSGGWLQDHHSLPILVTVHLKQYVPPKKTLKSIVSEYMAKATTSIWQQVDIAKATMNALIQRCVENLKATDKAILKKMKKAERKRKTAGKQRIN